MLNFETKNKHINFFKFFYLGNHHQGAIYGLNLGMIIIHFINVNPCLIC